MGSCECAYTGMLAQESNFRAHKQSEAALNANEWQSSLQGQGSWIWSGSHEKLSYVLGTGKDAAGWRRVIYARVITVGSGFVIILDFQAAGAKFGQEGRRSLMLSCWDEAR